MYSFENPVNLIIYDWVSFTTRIHSPTVIIDYLGLSGLDFESLNGRYCYTKRLYFDGINIYYDGHSSNGDMGVLVEMSGRGCRNFETYGSGDYSGLFDLILSHYSEDPVKCDMKITRLDVAYDDFIGLLRFENLLPATFAQNYVSRFKDYQCIIGSKGFSITHGSLSSNVFIRIYDKRKEQKVEKLVLHWVRCELQLRRECAYGFLLLKSRIEDSYFKVLNEYLRYIEPSDNVTNKSMCKTADFWELFLQSSEKCSIFAKPADKFSVDKLQNYVCSQLSGALDTYMNIVGIRQFLQDIYESRKGKKLNLKYQQLKQTHDASDAHVIADFLSRSKTKKEGSE